MFTAATPEGVIGAFIDASRSSRDACALAALLPESSAFYAGRSTNETARIRGYILAAFEHIGLPDAAVPYVLEELESGREPYLVAAAAKAARGAARPGVELQTYLLRAVQNIALRDDALSFESYRPSWPVAAPTTALTEIVRTFGWLGACARDAIPALEAWEADERRFSAAVRTEITRALARIRSAAVQHQPCCSPIGVTFAAPRRQPVAGGCVPPGIVLEDQDGGRFQLGQWCRGTPTIVTFFYTRCDNPNKCSLTIAKLADLQAALAERGLSGEVRTLAVTYDSGFDTPARLHQYGRSRGMIYTPDVRAVRVHAGEAELMTFFNPGVSFGPHTVNRHRIDLWLLDRRGQVALRFERAQWDVDRVLEETVQLLRDPAEPQ